MADVMFTEPAERDLLEIEHYIWVELCNPQASIRITNGILDATEKLGEYPMGYPLVNDRFLSSIGVRWRCFEHYNIFYFYNQINDVVYIIRILCNKVDWQEVLRK